MKIQRIEIHGFGKYRDYKQSFNDGLHVIYGKNEAGKTTLMNFILAMLFGMKKAGRKRVAYEETHARYVPWEGNRYGGILVCSINGETYRIERNFLRNKEDCRIYLELTGEDVTHRFPEDARKERLFLQTLTGADELMFKNALCLGEHMRTEWDIWRTETAPKLVSGAQLQTSDQTVIQKAESVIIEKLDEIGTERAESKLLGHAIAERKKITEQIGKEEANELAMQDISQELEAWNQACTQQKAELTHHKERVAGQIKRLLNHLEAEQAAADSALEASKQTSASLSPDLTREAFQTKRDAMYRKLESYRSIFGERENYKTRILDLQNVDPNSRDMVNRYQHITEEDMQRIEEINQFLSREIGNEGTGNAGDIRTEAVLGRTLNLSFLIVGIGAVLLAILVTFAGNAVAGILSAVLGIVTIVASRLIATRSVKQNESRSRQEGAAISQQTEQWEAELLTLLHRFDADTPKQARIRWQSILQARERSRAADSQAEWLQTEISKAEERLAVELVAIQKLSSDEKIRPDITPKELEALIKAWEDKSETLLQNQEMRVLAEQRRQEMARWTRRLQELDVKPEVFNSSVPALTLDQLNDELRAVEQMERAYLADMVKRAALEAKVQTLRQGRTKRVDLLRDLENWHEQERKWQRTKAAYQIAKDTLEEVRDIMYREQAPVLVQKVSQLAEQFTAGRYADIRVDNQLEVRVTSPDSGYTYEMTALSKGTMDQLGFALSLAVAESVVPNGDCLPLFIDEPFLHYDDQRLDATMRYLWGSTAKRQILFFTHRAEDAKRLEAAAGQPITITEL